MKSIGQLTDSKFSSRNDPFVCIVNSVPEHAISSVRTSYIDYSPLEKSFLTSVITAVCEKDCSCFQIKLPEVTTPLMRTLFVRKHEGINNSP